MAFVRERGRAMAAASAVAPTGMSAVLGGDPAEVAADPRAARADRRPTSTAPARSSPPAPLEQLAALAADPPAKARVIPLQVAGAFHTVHMAPAVEALGAQVRGSRPATPACPCCPTPTARSLRDGADVLARLVSQVSNPVRWDLCMKTFADLGVTGLIELPPAGTLVGLAKRALPGVETLALKTPDDLEAAQRMVREHGGSPVAGSPSADQEA